MKDWWLKFGCFLTGYNYYLVKQSSELSAKNVRKYTSAVMLIILVWIFIAFSFSTKYLHVSTFGGIISSIISAFVIIQIERIIILSSKLSIWSSGFRTLLAIVMAILGSFILDQIIFKDDIQLKKSQIMDQRVKEAIQLTESDLDKQIQYMDSSLLKLQNRAEVLSTDLRNNPVIVTSYTNSSTTRDNQGNKVNTTSSTNKMVNENPKKYELEQTLKQIENLTNQKFKVLESLSNVKQNKEKELKQSSGFLDELNILHEVVTSSGIGFLVYCLFFFFFLAIELFVLTIKLTDKESDYDKLIKHQTDMRVKMLEKLST